MNRILKVLLLATIITAFAITFTALTASAADTDNVVFIASNGTGDGSSPDSPIGNAEGYKPGNKNDIYNAFYLGLDKLKDTGGTLVIVGEVCIDTTEARFPENHTTKYAPCEFRCPNFKSNTSLTVTSVYDNVDYRKQGAKLILDYETCYTSTFMFDCNTTIDKLNIEYKYNEDHANSWNTSFMLGGSGNVFVIGSDVSVTSLNTKTGKEGTRYPILLGGHRWTNLKGNTDITVKSGTWDTVIAASHGMAVTTNIYGEVNGNANLKITGGKIGTVIGTGSLTQPKGQLKGKLSITLDGCEIDKLYLTNKTDYQGSNIKLDISKSAKVGEFFFAPDNYEGNLETLKSITVIKNNSDLIIDLPAETSTPETKAPETKSPETTAPEASEIPLLTQSPYEESMADPTETSTAQKSDGSSVIPPAVWVILAIAAAVIGLASFVINRIKMNMVK